jgi:hypothetical protein
MRRITTATPRANRVGRLVACRDGETQHALEDACAFNTLRADLCPRRSTTHEVVAVGLE